MIDGSTRVEIGGHRLQLFTKERTAPLMKEDDTENSKLSLHQVVVRVRGRVSETRILEANQPFTYLDGDKKRSLPAPKSGAWVKTDAGTRIIQQRLVSAQAMAEMDRIELDRDLRKPLAIALAMLMFFLGTVALLEVASKRRKLCSIKNRWTSSSMRKPSRRKKSRARKS